MRNNFLNQQIDDRKRIKQYYLEYCSACNFPNMPKLIIGFYKTTEKRSVDAYVNFKSYDGLSIELMIENLASRIYGVLFKSVCFHEFTHIYDIVKFRKNNTALNDISFYSEIHAAQIE